jgi:hypothetical protein
MATLAQDGLHNPVGEKILLQERCRLQDVGEGRKQDAEASRRGSRRGCCSCKGIASAHYTCLVVIGNQVGPEQDDHPQNHAAGGPGACQDTLRTVVQKQRAKQCPQMS